MSLLSVIYFTPPTVFLHRSIQLFEFPTVRYIFIQLFIFCWLHNYNPAYFFGKQHFMDFFENIDMAEIIFMRTKRIIVDCFLVNGLHGYPGYIAEAEESSVNRFGDFFSTKLIRIEEKDVLKQLFYVFISISIFWNYSRAFRCVFFDDPVYFIQKVHIVCNISKKTNPR